MTWSDAFEAVRAETAAPAMTPAEVAAAHFRVLREVLEETRAPLNLEDLF